MTSAASRDKPPVGAARFMSRFRYQVLGEDLIPLKPLENIVFFRVLAHVQNKASLNKNKNKNKNSGLQSGSGDGAQANLIPAFELSRLHQQASDNPFTVVRRFIWETLDIPLPPGPDLTRLETEVLLSLQARDRERARRNEDIIREATLDVSDFTKPLGIDGIAGFEQTEGLFQSILTACEYVGLIYKAKFDRTQPNQVEPRLRLVLSNPAHRAYPSNHSFQCHSIAFAFNTILPEHPATEELSRARSPKTAKGPACTIPATHTAGASSRDALRRICATLSSRATSRRSANRCEDQMSFSFTAPGAHYFLWHLNALRVIGFDPTPEGAAFDPAEPIISSTQWDRISSQFPGRTTPARVALIDVGASRKHPNLAGRIDGELSIDLVTHPHGVRSVPPGVVPAPFTSEGRHGFFSGLNLDGLDLGAVPAAGQARLADLVDELAQSKGVIRTLIDTDDTFGTHGTAIAGLVVGEPAFAAEGSMIDILADDESAQPSETVGLPPYFGVDPQSRLISIRTSFEQDAAHFIAAFLYAWKTGADVILLPRGIPYPVRAVLKHKPELDVDLDRRRNWERADLLARLDA